MGEYTYRLSLWIEHPEMDLAEVPVRLGLPATRLWKKGSARSTPKGRPIEGVYPRSFCGIELVDHEQADLPAGVRAALDLLTPHKTFLSELADKGAQIRLFVGWFSESNSRDILDWELLRDLAALKVSLDLDFYGPDPVEPPA